MKTPDKLFHIGTELAFLLTKFGKIKVYNIKLTHGNLTISTGFGIPWEIIYSMPTLHPKVYAMYFNLLGFLNHIFVPYQKLIYKLSYFYMIKKYPQFKKDLVDCVDYAEFLTDWKKVK